MGSVSHQPKFLRGPPPLGDATAGHQGQARIQGVGAGAGAHPWGGVSPLKTRFNSIHALVHHWAPSSGRNPASATEGWRKYSRGGGGGLGLEGLREKGSTSVSKGPKLHIQLLQLLKNSPREVKRAHFRYILVPSGSHPGNEINGPRRGRSLPVPPVSPAMPVTGQYIH